MTRVTVWVQRASRKKIGLCALERNNTATPATRCDVAAAVLIDTMQSDGSYANFNADPDGPDDGYCAPFARTALLNVSMF